MKFIEIPDYNNKIHTINTSKIIMFFPRLNGKTVLRIEGYPDFVTPLTYEEIKELTESNSPGQTATLEQVLNAGSVAVPTTDEVSIELNDPEGTHTLFALGKNGNAILKSNSINLIGNENVLQINQEGLNFSSPDSGAFFNFKRLTDTRHFSMPDASGTFALQETTPKTLILDTNDSQKITHTQSQTLLSQYLIPAKTIAVMGKLSLALTIASEGTAGTATIKIFKHNAPDPEDPFRGAVQLATYIKPASAPYTYITRNFALHTNQILAKDILFGFPAGESALYDTQSKQPGSEIELVREIDNYILVSVQLENAEDKIVQKCFELTFTQTQ